VPRPLARGLPPLPSPSRRYRPAAHDDAFIWPRGLGEGDDDTWADRLWEDMQRARRAAAAAAAAEQLRGFGAQGAAAAAATERRRRAEAAAAASARILAEERAKEANWRDAMLRQVAEVRVQRAPLCLRWEGPQRVTRAGGGLLQPARCGASAGDPCPPLGMAGQLWVYVGVVQRCMRGSSP
jgi:hypothetical protein